VPRQADIITVRTPEGEFGKWESLSVTNDITTPTQAVFTIGDEGVWQELQDLVSPGSEFTVLLNGHPRMKGRAEVNEVQLSPQSGTVLQLTIRTKVADARYASASPEVKVEDTSIKDFILACYGPLGFTEADFVFAPFAARNLITGEAAGAAAPEDFEEVKVDQAKVSPPETIYDAVERHLKRYGATQWDAPDGRVIVGRPDDGQDPTYKLQSKKGAASVANNMGAPRKIVDWSEVPLEINVYGASAGRSAAKASLKGVVINDDVQAVFDATGHFNRRVLIPTQQGKTQAQVDRAAQREMSARIRRIDAWQIDTDGWSYWNGERQIPWANNTTADVDVDTVGGPQGRYLIVRVDLKLSTTGGTTTTLQLVAPGVWVI
jgi:prophage tail gpP-like protein